VPSVDITNADLQKAVAEIAALIRPPTLEPGEVTAAMIAKQEKILPRKAAYQLEKAWSEGTLTKRKIKVDAHKPWAYRIVAPVTDSVTNVE